MPPHTTPCPTPSVPPLLVELWRLLDAPRPAVQQGRCFDQDMAAA